MSNRTQDSTDLIVSPIIEGTALDVFTSPEKADLILADIRHRIDTWLEDAASQDVSSARARKDITSFAWRITKSKTYLEAEGKRLADEQKQIPKKIDATRAKFKSSLDQWADDVRAPVTGWEKIENARIDAHKGAIAQIEAQSSVIAGLSAVEIKRRLDTVKAVPLDDTHCAEFLSEYALATDAAIAALTAALFAREVFEAEQAELAQLRAERAERDAKDREAQQARDAMVAAEQAASAAVERERKAAQDTIDRERAESAAREARLAAEVERAKREAAETESRVRAAAEAKAAAEKAEADRREANRTHRARVHRAIIEAFARHGIDEPTAKSLITAIAKGEVPHVIIAY